MITCIVVDDDKTITSLFSDLLGFMGFKVLAQGHSGSDAVSLYKKHHPEIIFIDIMMPQTDGIYAIKNIKKIDSDAKIITVTADSTTDTLEKLDELKVHARIKKPFNQDEIKNVLRSKFKIVIR
jgi:DNA-binding NarL/FixJ family response regulator